MDDDADVFGYHFEDGSLAVNLFHVRAGKIVDRREFFWEDLPELLEAATPEDLDQPETLGAPGLDFEIRDTTKLGAPSIPRSSAEWVGGHEPTHREPNETLGAPGLDSETWETTKPEPHFHAGQLFAALLKQLYIDQHYVPRSILLPADFDDREALAHLLTERTGHRIEIAVPQRGEKRSLVDLAGQNAKQSYIQRFRVLEPSRKAIQEALAEALMLAELPHRIECFDISHIQGAETVASLVVWEDGKMNKQLYRKFKIKTVRGVDDFASMREVIHRRYRRLLDEIKAAGDVGQSKNLGAPSIPRSSAEWVGDHEPQSVSVSDTLAGAPDPDSGTWEATKALKHKEPASLPSLILVDGGLGQLHSAAEALESLGLTTQPLASIAKREEVIYLYGNEDEPIVLDRHSPVLHLVQLIRDESHRFAVGYHRQRRAMRDRESEILLIPGVGPQTRQRLLTHFGSLREVREATVESLTAVVPRKTAESIWRHFHGAQLAIE
jgi:excinuclease ABC subunit C